MTGRTVVGNRWHQLAIDPSATAGVSVSVCVPYAGESDRLAVSLVGLADVMESFPGAELVIADGTGSLPDSGLPPRSRVVRGPFREGSSPAASRNAAAAAATGDVLVFVDADIVVDRRSFDALVRWFTSGDSVLALGRLRFVDASPADVEPLRKAIADDDTEQFFAERDLGAGDWRERYFELTEDLRRDRNDLFRVVTGGIMAVRRDDFERIGGFLPIETRGVEDIEFGYRCWSAGLFLVTAKGALGWHQGVPTMRGERARSIAAERAPALARLLPVGGFRTKRSLAREAWVPFVPQLVTHRTDTAGTTVADPALGGDAVTEETDSRIVVMPYAHVWIDGSTGLSRSSRAALLAELARSESGVVYAIAGEAVVLVACTSRALARCGRTDFGPEVSRDVGRELGARWTTAARLGLGPSTANSGVRSVWRAGAVGALGWIHRRASAIVPVDR